MSTDDSKTIPETDDKLDDSTLDQVSGGVAREELRRHEEKLHADVFKK